MTFFVDTNVVIYSSVVCPYRAGRLDELAEIAHTLFTPLLPITDDSFKLALALDAPHLGCNDRLHVGTCLSNGIELIISADRGFGGVAGVRRIDPADTEGWRLLLARS